MSALGRLPINDARFADAHLPGDVLLAQLQFETPALELGTKGVPVKRDNLQLTP